ncbi:hypothetical protein [Nocardioides alcanivorans]|uniref:hypothetical protein n=1 Tax=Nocardioides alcanivorans TaxID=2897352 RepID=UPI001F1FE733|nr:hypothetical protein [Nocardioides alcanivorans]
MTQYLPHLHQGHEHHQHDHVSAAGATRIDCDTCAVRGPACNDCVISVLLGPPPELAFDDEERRALDVLAAGGLVPPLRLVTAVEEPVVDSA